MTEICTKSKRQKKIHKQIFGDCFGNKRNAFKNEPISDNTPVLLQILADNNVAIEVNKYRRNRKKKRCANKMQNL